MSTPGEFGSGGDPEPHQAPWRIAQSVYEIVEALVWRKEEGRMKLGLSSFELIGVEKAYLDSDNDFIFMARRK